MVRPEWMGGGRIYHTGVPERLAYGRHTSNRNSRLRFARKMGDRDLRQKQIEAEKIKYPHIRKLTKEQSIAGARLVI